MATYMMLMKMTPDGAKRLKEWPASIDGAVELAIKMGGKPVGFYACGALYDFVAIGEFSNDDSVEMFRRLIISMGMIDGQVIRLYTKEEFDRLIEAIEVDS